jgi:hypothetical protein
VSPRLLHSERGADAIDDESRVVVLKANKMLLVYLFFIFLLPDILRAADLTIFRADDVDDDDGRDFDSRFEAKLLSLLASTSPMTVEAESRDTDEQCE